LPSGADDVVAVQYDGAAVDELARRLSVPRVAAFQAVGSTLDVAHALAADGADSGTLIVADAQTAGRGRMGRTWRSEPGAGVWLTLVERPASSKALEVLSLRIGIALAPGLDQLAGGRVRLKWPNDLYVGDDKLAGVLIEARWKDGAPEWVAIGVGINVRVPEAEPRAAGLRPGVTRLDVLDVVVPAIRAAARKSGPLSDEELAIYADRDLASGRVCVSPVAGRVAGIDSSGALRVDVGSEVTAVRGGSLVFLEEQ
jgi:BirA family biotin operon repressor/biotin-[acetyl-CoA-carboxylase] ligase